MKMKTRHIRARTLLLTLGIFFLGLTRLGFPSNSQGICLPEPLVVTGVYGRVVAQLEKGETPLSRASLSLFKDQYEESLVAETIADDNGRFNFQHIKSGKYVLSITVPNLPPFSVRLRVRASKAGTSKEELVVSMGAQADKPCGGTLAEVRRKN